MLLTRVGEFYETYGVDAVMMMQHAGLNKMGQEVRAGCPRKNVQQTLDGLTGAGLTVAVYEEARESPSDFLCVDFAFCRFWVWFGFGFGFGVGLEVWIWFGFGCGFGLG